MVRPSPAGHNSQSCIGQTGGEPRRLQSAILRNQKSLQTGRLRAFEPSASERSGGNGIGAIGSFGQTKVLAQCRLVDLAGGVARQGFDEPDHVRPLEARQGGLAMRLYL